MKCPWLKTMKLPTAGSSFARKRRARSSAASGDSPPGQPSVQMSQAGRSFRMSAVVIPSYSP
jgi:hypothetical protein